MARILIFLLLLLGTGLVSSQSIKNGLQVVEGEVFNTGHLLKTDRFVLRLTNPQLLEELSFLSGKKIRALCDVQGETCALLRYELEPFESKSATPWALKKIPRYVTAGLFAFNPQCTPDGKILFWTALVKESGRSTQKIWYSKRDNFGFWSPGEQMSQPLNNRYPSAVISALPGGNELFLFGNFGEDELLENLRLEMKQKSVVATREALTPRDFHLVLAKLESEYKERSETIYNRAPLYKTQKITNGWSIPQQIPFPSFYNWYKKADNPSQQVFGGSALSSSGRILLYSAQQKRNFGKLDLYVTQQNEKGIFEEGINLGNLINTSEEEMAPFLAPDDRTLYYSSSGRKEGTSIFFTRRIGEGWTSWTEPQELSSNLRGVNFFSIPAHGQWAYVSREGELFMASIPEAFQPEPVVLVLGKVIDEQGRPLSAPVLYESLSKKKIIGSTISNPETGEFSLVLPYDENYGFFAEKEGYLPVSQNLNLTGIKKEGTQRTVILKLPEIKSGNQITINNVFFEFRSSELAKESEPELDRLAFVLQKHIKGKITIEGHTDSIGNPKANQKLSLERAISVANYLKSKHNIEESRLLTVGKGSSVPISDNGTEEGRKANRRVMFRITEE